MARPLLSAGTPLLSWQCAVCWRWNPYLLFPREGIAHGHYCLYFKALNPNIPTLKYSNLTANKLPVKPSTLTSKHSNCTSTNHSLNQPVSNLKLSNFTTNKDPLNLSTQSNSINPLTLNLTTTRPSNKKLQLKTPAPKSVKSFLLIGEIINLKIHLIITQKGLSLQSQIMGYSKRLINLI